MHGALSGLKATALMSAAFAVHPGAPPPPKVITDNAFRKAGLPPIPGAWVPAHLAFGATLGHLRERLGARRIPFGLAVWLTGYATSLPLLGLYPALTRDHRRRAAASLASHLVFAAALRE